jgi:hypothetical protein
MVAPADLASAAPSIIGRMPNGAKSFANWAFVHGRWSRQGMSSPSANVFTIVSLDSRCVFSFYDRQIFIF